MRVAVLTWSIGPLVIDPTPLSRGDDVKDRASLIARRDRSLAGFASMASPGFSRLGRLAGLALQVFEFLLLLLDAPLQALQRAH
jgi:hypothetical protein